MASAAIRHDADGTVARDIGWCLGVVLRAHHRSLATVLGDLPHGPRGYLVLAAVLRGDQPSQLALAEHLGIDRTVMTYLIDDLVAAGLAERRPHPGDRRRRQVVATPLGTRTFAELERRVAQVEDVVLGALEPAERDTFRSLLRRVAQDVSDDESLREACALVARVLAADESDSPAR